MNGKKRTMLIYVSRASGYVKLRFWFCRDQTQTKGTVQFVPVAFNKFLNWLSLVQLFSVFVARWMKSYSSNQTLPVNIPHGHLWYNTQRSEKSSDSCNLVNYNLIWPATVSVCLTEFTPAFPSDQWQQHKVGWWGRAAWWRTEGAGGVDECLNQVSTLPKVPSGGLYCLGNAFSWSELKAYFLLPTFFIVFSLLQPSLWQSKIHRLHKSYILPDQKKQRQINKYV